MRDTAMRVHLVKKRFYQIQCRRRKEKIYVFLRLLGVALFWLRLRQKNIKSFLNRDKTSENDSKVCGDTNT